MTTEDAARVARRPRRPAGGTGAGDGPLPGLRRHAVADRDDPEAARPLAGVVELLGPLAARFAAVALVSGRPADDLAEHASRRACAIWGCTSSGRSATAEYGSIPAWRRAARRWWPPRRTYATARRPRQRCLAGGQAVRGGRPQPAGRRSPASWSGSCARTCLATRATPSGGWSLSGAGTVALSDHPVRLPPLHRSKTTDHGTVEWFDPFSAPCHEGEPPRCWASPAHSGSMQQCRLRQCVQDEQAAEQAGYSQAELEELFLQLREAEDFAATRLRPPSDKAARPVFTRQPLRSLEFQQVPGRHHPEDLAGHHHRQVAHAQGPASCGQPRPAASPGRRWPAPWSCTRRRCRRPGCAGRPRHGRWSRSVMIPASR